MRVTGVGGQGSHFRCGPGGLGAYYGWGEVIGGGKEGVWSSGWGVPRLRVSNWVGQIGFAGGSIPEDYKKMRFEE